MVKKIVYFLVICIFSLGIPLFAQETPRQESWGEIEKLENEQKKMAEQKEALKEIEPEKIEYNASNLKNPFKSYLPKRVERQSTQSAAVEPAYQASNPPNVIVQGMVWDSEKPQAIINNKVLRVGDSIDGAEVTDIKKEGVSLKHGGIIYIFKPSSPLLELKKEGGVW